MTGDLMREILEEIHRKLDEIEQAEDVKILLAVESEIGRAHV